MKRTLIALAAVFFGGVALAQTSTAVKESGKAVSEKALEAKETVQGAVTSEPKKSVHKAKAKAHASKSAMHDRKAKAAGAKSTDTLAK